MSVSLPRRTLCVPVPLHGLRAVIGISVSGFASLNLEKNPNIEKTAGVQTAPWFDVILPTKAWCSGMAQGDIRWVLQQEERASPHVPRWGGDGRMGPAGSQGLFRWLSSSHQNVLAGSMLPSSAALEKCSESPAPLSEVVSPQGIRAVLTTAWDWVLLCSSCEPVNIQYTQLRHLQLLFRICVRFQQ